MVAMAAVAVWRNPTEAHTHEQWKNIESFLYLYHPHSLPFSLPLPLFLSLVLTSRRKNPSKIGISCKLSAVRGKNDTTKNWDRYCDGINFKLNKSHAFAFNSLLMCTVKVLRVCVSHSTSCISYFFFPMRSRAIAMSVFMLCSSLRFVCVFFFCYGNDGNVFRTIF